MSKFTRMEIHRHNGFLGHAKMMQMQLKSIIAAKTTTLATKELAQKMYNDTHQLQAELRDRAE